MKRFINIIRKIQLLLRRAYWEKMAQVYSLCISKSQAVTLGSCTLYVESYCELIEGKCRNLDIIIPDSDARKPNKVQQLFMSYCFGWPRWPIRVILYQGQRLERIETAPDEIANILQTVFKKLSNEFRTKMSQKTSGSSARIKEHKDNHRKEPPKIRARITFPEPARKTSSLNNIDVRPCDEQPKDLIIDVDGATLDYSF